MNPKMKRLLATTAMVAATAATAPEASAASYVVDADHTVVEFKIRHLVGKVTGHFTSFEGTIDYDPAKPAAARVEGTIQVESIDTRNAKRDEHLRSPDFFAAAEHPTIRFASTRMIPTGEGRGTLVGELTMRGVTRTVELQVEFTGAATDPWGNVMAGFSGTTTIDRKDFGIEWNETLDQGGLLLGEEVEIAIFAEGNLKTQ